jgi:hypothetical protein
MAFTPAWRNFKRMQDVTVAIAALIYAGATVRAFGVLPGGAELIAQRTLIWPGVFLLLSFAVPLRILALRRRLARYVWMSFQAGFGQTPFSVAAGLALLGGAAGFIYWQIEAVSRGGQYPAAIFSAYGSGMGILAAQALLARVLEKDPKAREFIEEK